VGGDDLPDAYVTMNAFAVAMLVKEDGKSEAISALQVGYTNPFISICMIIFY
jgi:hypothetical protein